MAVVPVILFHTGIPWFGGGYVGVDIFFVISGFLITAIILDECETGTFTITGFYERRMRRILPALFLMMFCTIPFAWWWMPPLQLKEYADSLVATAIFSSNFLFWSEAGYFAAAAAEKPLLHTWSLAIEEQFYLVFPVMMSMFWFLGKWKLAVYIGIIASASFVLSAWVLSSDADTNFYLMPSRAWELLAGSILAFIERHKPLRMQFGLSAVQALSILGLILIIYPVIAYDDRTPISGISTLLPVAGTWLLLAFAVPGTFAGRILSQGWLVSIGLMSYSAYLWHQPLFAFARLRNINAPCPFLYGCLCIMIGFLAYLSWKYVELPFRHRQRFARRQIFAFTAVAAVSTCVLGLVGGLTNIRYFGYPENVLAAIEPASSADLDCDWQVPLPEFPKVRVCHFGAQAGGSPIVLWGDSHADALFSAADESFKATNNVGWRVNNDHCRPIVGIYNTDKFSLKNVGICTKSQAALLDFLRVQRPRAIIIAIRWTFQLYPIEGKIEDLGFNNGEGGQEMETYRTYSVPNSLGQPVTNAALKATAIRQFITSFTATGATVLVQYPVPEVGWHIPKLNFKYLVSFGVIPPVISTSIQRYDERNAFITEILDSVVTTPSILAIRVSEILCDSSIADRCAAQINGVPLYADDDHLSKEGAKLVIEKILSKIQ